MKTTQSVAVLFTWGVILFCTLVLSAANPANAQTATPYGLPPQSSAPLQIVTGNDVNSNGLEEVLVLHKGTDLHGQYAAYYELTNTGARQLWDFTLPQSLDGDIVDILLGDMDANERAEILCIASTIAGQNQTNRTPWLFAFEWDGATFSEGETSRWSYQATDGVNLRPTNFTASDFDGDGNAELAVIFGSPERIGLIVQRDGSIRSGVWTPEFQFSLPNNESGAYRFYLRKTDLTADAIDELLLFSVQKEVGTFVYTYIDANRYAPATSLQFPFAAETNITDPQIDFADLNRDGFTDILMGSQSGEMYYLTRPDAETEIFRFQSFLLQHYRTPVTSLVPQQLSDGTAAVVYTLRDSSVIYTATLSFPDHSVTPEVSGVERYQDPSFLGYRFSGASVNTDEQGITYGIHGAETRSQILVVDLPGFAPVGVAIQKSHPEVESEKQLTTMRSKDRTPDKIAYIGKEFLYSVDFDILSLDNLSIDFAAAPNGMRYNHRASRLEWTPKLSQKGFHEVEINIRSANYKHTEKFTVLAKVDPPRIISDPPTVITAGEPWEYQVKIADQDVYDTLKFSLLESPENMSVNSRGWMYWLPNLNQVDDQSVTLAVSDGYDIDTQTFSVYVNAPPSFLSQPDTFITVGQEYSYNVLVGDRNKNAKLEVSLDQGPRGMTLQGRNLTWTPTQNQVDYFPVRLTLTDGFLTTTQRWTIFVNAPPKIVSTPISSLAHGQEYRYRINVEDPNTDSNIRYTLDQGPEGMTIDETGLLTWKPASTTINRQSFKIRITDGYATDTQDGSVFINVPPKFVSEPEIVAVSELPYKYELQGEDANGDPIRFSAIRLPKYAKFDSTDNVITWKPTLEQIGKQPFKLQITDSHGATSVQEFAVQVYENPGTKPLIFSGYYILIAVLGGIFVMTAAL